MDWTAGNFNMVSGTTLLYINVTDANQTLFHQVTRTEIDLPVWHPMGIPTAPVYLEFARLRSSNTKWKTRRKKQHTTKSVDDVTREPHPHPFSIFSLPRTGHAFAEKQRVITNGVISYTVSNTWELWVTERHVKSLPQMGWKARNRILNI